MIPNVSLSSRNKKKNRKKKLVVVSLSEQGTMGGACSVYSLKETEPTFSQASLYLPAAETMQFAGGSKVTSLPSFFCCRRVLLSCVAVVVVIDGG